MFYSKKMEIPIRSDMIKMIKVTIQTGGNIDLVLTLTSIDDTQEHSRRYLNTYKNDLV